MASPIVDTWVHATMLVENQWKRRGTGFLVARSMGEDAVKVFLVTNKHVIHKEVEQRAQAFHVILHLNVKEEDGHIAGKVIQYPLRSPDGEQTWREHPDRDVDVMVIDVTPILVERPQVSAKWADYSSFADSATTARLGVTMGDEVLVIGYPLGLRHRTTNYPLVRQGIIATMIGENLEDEVEERDGSVRKRTLRGFLIDGATVPGSSGSPVVLKPAIGRFVGDNVLLGPTQPVLLGIVAETRYAPVTIGGAVSYSFAGLGLAFAADTIRETVELFFI